MPDSAQVGALVLKDVLARMVFLAGDPCRKEDLPVARRPVVVRMVFRGPPHGELALALPGALCAQVAANLLGLDDDDPRAEAGGVGAAEELLNVTCGHVLVALLGDAPVFDLRPPSSGPLDEPGWDALRASPDSSALLVEDEHPVLLRVAMEA
jgi:hypothetical protein